MTRLTDEPAYVLHARPWRESSLLLELLTAEHGRVGAVARGVRGPRKQPLRAALQPMVPLRVGLVQHGELALLTAVEAVGAAAALGGERLLAGFYLNELLVRLLPRQDAAPAVFARYAQALAELAGDLPLAWALRRIERDVLELLGFVPPLERDAGGQTLLAERRYRLEAERGPVPCGGSAGSVSGAALLALAADRMPDAAGLRELREALRGLIAAHLGGRGLRSWGLLAEFARAASPLR